MTAVLPRPAACGARRSAAGRARSQSKFIVSRSKYSGNLLLVLQDDAVVHLS